MDGYAIQFDYSMIIVLINVLVPDLNTTPRTHHLLHPDCHNLIMFVIVLFYLNLFLYAWMFQATFVQRQYISKHL